MESTGELIVDEERWRQFLQEAKDRKLKQIEVVTEEVRLIDEYLATKPMPMKRTELLTA